MEAPQARKSIGAQVYYGVRLDGDADADKFLDDLAGPALLQTFPPKSSSVLSAPLETWCIPELGNPTVRYF